MKLCYVEPETRIMFFCEKEPTEVWGDDWNDVPWEHNAGRPNEADGPFRLMVIDAAFDLPGGNQLNSSYSVEMINAGAVAWLVSPSWAKDKLVIKAGDEYGDVLKRCRDAGLLVFIEAT